jgi:hypothetical protein
MRCFSKTLANIWYSLFPVLYALNGPLIEEYSKQYRGLKKERIFHQFIGSYREDPDLGIWNNLDSGTEQRTQARHKRQGGFYQNLLECDPHRIESEKQFEKAECIPFVFEETLERELIDKHPSRVHTEETMEEFEEQPSSKSVSKNMQHLQQFEATKGTKH